LLKGIAIYTLRGNQGGTDPLHYTAGTWRCCCWWIGSSL
jgi:hypothetical protein